MKLFLVQHGEAKSKSEDPVRPLNATGISNAGKVAHCLAEALGEVTQIQHSGKRRAEQTAEIFAGIILPTPSVCSVSGLCPNDDVLPVVDKLELFQGSLMIVSHLPFLSRLAAQLLVGRSEADLVRFENAGVVCLELDDGHWRLSWSLVPELLAD